MRRSAFIAPAILFFFWAHPSALSEPPQKTSVKQELFRSSRSLNGDVKAVRGSGTVNPRPGAAPEAPQVDEEKKKGAIQRLFDVLKGPWVDFKPIRGAGGEADKGGAESSGDLGNSGDASRETAGGAGAGGASSGNTKQIEMDDNRPKGASGDAEEEDPSGADGGSGGGTPAVSGSSSGAARSNARPLGHFWPMCLFLDSYISEAEGNKTIKGIIDAAAKCDVQMVIFPITVRAGSDTMTPDAINAAQTRACNFKGKIKGATRASTSACVDHDQMADIMCDQKEKIPEPPYERYKRETAGCAQMQSGGGEDVEKLLREAGYDKNSSDPEKVKEYWTRKNEIDNHMKGGSGPAGQAAPSIEDRGQCTAGIVSHEAIGHSQFGHPNGTGDGFGIGAHKETQMTDGWDPPGCAAMKRNAFPNTDKMWLYEPNRQKYYSKVNDPSRQYDLTNDPPIFSPRKPVPAKGPVSPDTRLRSSGGGRVQTVDGASKALPKSQPIPSTKVTQPQGGAPTPSDSTDYLRHKSKPGAPSGSQTLVDSVRDSGGGVHESDPEPAESPMSPAPGPSSSPVPAGGRVQFNDNAPKNKSGKSGGSGVAAQPRTNINTPGENSSYDDGGSDSYSSSVSSPSSGSYSTRGSAVGFDDNAPKNQPGLSLGSPGRSGSSATPGETREADRREGETLAEEEDGSTTLFRRRDSEKELEGDRKPSSKERRDRRRTQGDNTPRRNR